MHPLSRHQRSQSGRDLDEAVSKLEQARDVLLDAKVKTNEALTKAATTIWQRECRRAPREFGPDSTLQTLVPTSRSASPAASPNNKTRGGNPNRTLALTNVQHLAHINRPGVAYSTKSRKLEVKQCTMMNYAAQLLPHTIPAELLDSLNQIIRRRKPQTFHNSDKKKNRAPNSLLRVVPITTFGDHFISPTKALTTDEQYFNSGAASSDTTVSSTYNAQFVDNSKFTSGSSQSRVSSRTIALSEIKSVLQSLQDQLHHIPDARHRRIESLSQDDSTSLHGSGESGNSTVVCPIKTDLRHLELTTREVLGALSRRYKG